jgi:hypothetical protein
MEDVGVKQLSSKSCVGASDDATTAAVALLALKYAGDVAAPMQPYRCQFLKRQA